VEKGGAKLKTITKTTSTRITIRKSKKRGLTPTKRSRGKCGKDFVGGNRIKV